MPSHALLPQKGVLIGRDHIIGGSVRIVQEQFAMSRRRGRTWHTGGLQVCQAVVETQRRQAHGPGVRHRGVGRMAAHWHVGEVVEEIFAVEGPAESLAVLWRVRHDIKPAVASLVQSVKGGEPLLFSVREWARWLALIPCEPL